VVLLIYFIRVFFAQGWYIVTYALGIYLLNLFLAFLQPKIDPSLEMDMEADSVEEGGPMLPTRSDEEFRPFVRRLPEFKFWYVKFKELQYGSPACTNMVASRIDGQSSAGYARSTQKTLNIVTLPPLDQ